MASASKTKKIAKSTLLAPSQFQSRPQNLRVIDVRGRLEYWMGHVPGAERMNRDQILKRVRLF